MTEGGQVSGEGLWAETDESTALRRYRALAAAIDDGVCQLDGDGCVVAADDVFAARAGRDRESLVGEHVSAFLPPADADRVEQAVGDLGTVEGGAGDSSAGDGGVTGPQSGGEVAELDLSMRTLSGERLPSELRLTPIPGDGETPGVVGVLQERTDGEDSETAHGREPSLLDRVFETSPIGISALAPDGEIIAINDRAVEIVGDDPDGIPETYDPGRWPMFDADGDRVPPAERPLARIVETGDPLRNVEAQVAVDDGNRVWLRFNGVPVTDADGDLSMVVLTYEDVTDRKAREQQLRRERAQTEKILETAPVALVVTDADGETLLANERAQEFLGLSEREIIDEPDDAGEWELLDESGEPLPAAETPSARVMASGEPLTDEEIAIEPPGGERRWYRVDAAPVYGPDGAVQRVITAGEDVTELKRRERQLARRRDALETELGEVLDRISDGFFALDEDFRFTHVNERAHELINPGGRTLVGEHVWDAFPAGAERTFKAEYERAMADQETVTFEEYYPDPLDTWFEVRAYPSETGLSVYFRDVTDRKERERELRRYETIVEAVNDGVYVVDEDSELLMVNEAYAEMLGYDREELVGEHSSKVVDESVIDQARQLQSATVEGTIDRPAMEAEMRTADGDTVPVEATFAPLPESDPGPGHRVGVVRDIGERKRRERAIQERERQLSTLMENIPGMVYRCRNEPGWPMAFVSEGCRDLTGYDPAAIESGEVSFGGDVVLEADREKLREDVQAGLADDGTFLVTYRIRTADGDVRWVRERGRAVGTSPDADDGTTGTDAGAEPDLLEGVIIDVTERKQLEAELDEVFGRVTDAFYALDDQWRITYINEETASVLGRTPEELRGTVVWDAFPELVDTAVEERFREAMTTQEPVTFERRSALLDTWVAARVYPSETGLSVYLEDVSERKADERELEARSAAMEASIEGMAILDEDEEYVFVNQAHADIYGYDDPEAFIGETWRVCYDAAEAERLESEAMAELYETGSWRGEATGIRKDGSTFPQEISLTALDDGQLICVVRDVTEQKARERELARYEVLFTESRDVNGVLAPDGTFEYVTPSAERVLGYEPGELVGENAFEFVHPEDRDRVAGTFGDLVEDPEHRPTVEYRFEHADGSWIVLESRGRNLLDESDIEGIVVYSRDVTERVERERELEESRQRYRTLVEHVPNGAVALVDENLYYRTFGGTPIDEESESGEAIEGKSLRDALSPELADAVEPRYRAAFDGESSAFEHEQHGRSYQIRIVPVRDDDGEVFAAMGMSQDVTGRVERERQLEESERRYRTLVEHFPNGAVGLFDENLEYTAVGGQLLEAEGLEAEDRVGNSVHDIYPDDIVDQVEPYFHAALEGQTNSFEVELRGRNLFAYTLPVRDADDAVFAGMLVVQDVTERREIEQDLRESEAKFRLLAENLDEVVWMASAEVDEIIYVNPAYEDVWGREVDELYEDPMAFVEGIHPDDRERVREAFTSLPGHEFDEEFRIRRPDGEVRWLHVTGAQVRDDDGEIVRIVGIGDDVTERVERERALEESERRYRTLAEHFPNGAVGVYDDELRYTLAAGARLGEDLPGSDQLEGERLPDVFPSETATDLEPVFRAAVADGETGNTETTLGGRHWRVWATPLRDADDEVFAGLSFAQDVTEQVERKQRLEDLVTQLEASNERLEQFAYAASHDLQEPLRMVSSYLSLVDRRYGDDLDEEGREFLEFAVDGAERMREMIDALLTYSRVETRGDPFEPVDLDEVFADVRRDYRVRIEETGADVTAESLPTVHGDADQLRQVLGNLLSNALEYSGADPPAVEVTTARVGRDAAGRDAAGSAGAGPTGREGRAGPDGGRWRIGVHDEGIGIDPDQTEAIFQVFQRLHTHDEHPGTGIGLALCQRIVERHGGDIWVESEPGEGSSFYFTLPSVPGDQT